MSDLERSDNHPAPSPAESDTSRNISLTLTQAAFALEDLMYLLDMSEVGALTEEDLEDRRLYWQSHGPTLDEGLAWMRAHL